MTLEEFIKNAVYKLIEKDKYLLENDVNERAITHKLAEHMQHIVGDLLNVDCEYNRNINGDDIVKKIYCDSNGEDEKYIKYIEDIEDIIKKIQNLNNNKKDSIIVNPDIIVHRRGESEHNTIIVEAKKSSSSKNSKLFDDAKLKLYTSDKELKYSYGIYIEFSNKNEEKKKYIKEIRYYKNGEVNNECKDDNIFLINKPEE